MTEPTLTELRQIARRTVTRRHHESEEGMLATAFLSLTDQLTAVTADRDGLQQRLDAAPVSYLIHAPDGRLVEQWEKRVLAELEARASWPGSTVTRVRLVTDDQPGE